MEKFELTLDEDNSIIIPEPVLKELKMKKGDTFEYSHSLKSIIEPLFSLGFVMTGFYSDEAGNEVADSYLFDSFLAFNFLNADSLNIPVF